MKQQTGSSTTHRTRLRDSALLSLAVNWLLPQRKWIERRPPTVKPLDFLWPIRQRSSTSATADMAKPKVTKPEPRRPVYLIEWFDAHDSAPHWMPEHEVGVDRVVVQSVGFLLPETAETADHVRLVTSDVYGEVVGGGINIPKVNVVRRRRLS